MRKTQPPSSPQHFFTLLSEIEPGRLRKIHQYNGELHNFSTSDQLKKAYFLKDKIIFVRLGTIHAGYGKSDQIFDTISFLW